MKNELLYSILNLIYPNKCIFCNEIISKKLHCCMACARAIERLEDKICNKCGNCTCICSEEYYKKLYSAIYYTDSSKQAILSLKFASVKVNAKILTKYLYKRMKKDNLLINFDVIIPVPLYISDYLYRGYNQSYLIAVELAKLLNCSVNIDILKKRKKTKKQHSLTSKKREKNLLNAYKVNVNAAMLDKNILILDDIFTTGNTINETAKILYNNGYKNLYVATVYRSELGKKQ